jgi:hypothetical protein
MTKQKTPQKFEHTFQDFSHDRQGRAGLQWV